MYVIPNDMYFYLLSICLLNGSVGFGRLYAYELLLDLMDLF
jgi:hypothetical protein